MKGLKIFFLFSSIIYVLVTVCSCKKKYDYGNIVTPDLLADYDGGVENIEVPPLGEKIPIVVDWTLDENGLEKLKNLIESVPDNSVELDLRNCDVPVGDFSDTSLPKYFFSGMTNLVSVVLPERLLTVSSGLFRDCVNLKKVTLCSRLSSIEGHAFKGCVSLREIYTSGNPLYIFSYDGDGLEYPDGKNGFNKARVFYDKNEIEYINWYQFCWDYSKRLEPKKVAMAETWATSAQNGFDAKNLSDGGYGTWFENSNGDGVGEEIVMHFTRMNTVSTITFRNGNGNTKNFWKSNRVKDLDIYFGNDPSPVSITLADNCENQIFKFLYGTRKLMQFDKIRFVIKSVYGNYKETCMAEIGINDENLDGYKEDPYTKEMIDAIPKPNDGFSSEYKIWRPVESYPVMLVFDKIENAEDFFTENLRCFVYDGNSWTPSQKIVTSQITSVLNSKLDANKRYEFSFTDDFDFKIQFKRDVKLFPDAPFGEPYLFDFDGQKFVLRKQVDFSAKKLSINTKDFFQQLESLSPYGIYRIDLKGELDEKFFSDMQKLMAAEKELARNRNYILNMWDCTYSYSLQDTLNSESLCGYFIQLVLPKTTKRICKSSVCVASDIISIPSSIDKIDAGAFVSSKGSEYNLYQNNVAFDGDNFARGYSVEGRLLLESIPDSGGRKRLLLYCGNASEFFGTENSSKRNLILPDNVIQIAPHAFYGSDLSSIVFPTEFEEAQEKCFDLCSVKKVDLSKVDVEKLSMESARQFGVLLSSNPDVEVVGDFYCVSATGKMTDNLVKKIGDEIKKRENKKVYLDLSGTTLQWLDEEKKYYPLPEEFLFRSDNLYWVRLGYYNYFPQNCFRDCKNLRWVEFLQVPDRIAEPSFKGCHATAQALVGPDTIPLWDFVKELN